MTDTANWETPWLGPLPGPRPDAIDDEQSFDVFLQAFDDAPLGLILIRPDGSYARVNRLLLQYTGETFDALMSAPRGTHTHPDDRGKLQEVIRRLRTREALVETAAVRVRNAEGGYTHFDCVLNGIYRPSGELRVIVVHLIDVTALRTAEVSLQEQRQRDPRSGALLEQVFPQALSDAVRVSDAAARWVVLAVGIDVAEIKGRLVSSGAVTPWEGRFADFIRPELPRGALLGEHGSGVFVCAAPVRDEAMTADIALRIRSAVERALFANDLRRAPVRFGAAPISSGDDAAVAVNEAVFALEKASFADNALVWADEALKRARQRRAWLGEQLPRALRSGGLCVHYQPIVDLNTTGLLGGEALVRWNGPALATPGEFIPIAEQAGLIGELDHWIIRTAIAEWAHEFRDGYQLHVNCSARTFEASGFSARVVEYCREARFNPSQLVIELTESSRILEPDGVREAIRQLKSEGVRFAVDDFGTGNAWFDMVSGYDPQIVKLDIQFARRLGGTTGNRLAAAAIATGHAVGAQVIAEGIERAGQAAIFRQFGANAGQGFFYGAAVPLQTFVERV